MVWDAIPSEDSSPGGKVPVGKLPVCQEHLEKVSSYSFSIGVDSSHKTSQVDPLHVVIEFTTNKRRSLSLGEGDRLTVIV